MTVTREIAQELEVRGRRILVLALGVVVLAEAIQLTGPLKYGPLTLSGFSEDDVILLIYAYLFHQSLSGLFFLYQSRSETAFSELREAVRAIEEHVDTADGDVRVGGELRQIRERLTGMESDVVRARRLSAGFTFFFPIAVSAIVLVWYSVFAVRALVSMGFRLVS